MKTSEQKFFPGAGYLTGFIIILSTAIPAFLLTENFVVSVLSIPVGVTLGIILEQQFQGRRSVVTRRMKSTMIALLIIGIIAFITVSAIVNF